MVKDNEVKWVHRVFSMWKLLTSWLWSSLATNTQWFSHLLATGDPKGQQPRSTTACFWWHTGNEEVTGQQSWGITRLPFVIKELTQCFFYGLAVKKDGNNDIWTATTTKTMQHVLQMQQDSIPPVFPTAASTAVPSQTQTMHWVF